MNKYFKKALTIYLFLGPTVLILFIVPFVYIKWGLIQKSFVPISTDGLLVWFIYILFYGLWVPGIFYWFLASIFILTKRYIFD